MSDLKGRPTMGDDSNPFISLLHDDPIAVIEAELAFMTRVIQWLHRSGYERLNRSAYLIARVLETMEPIKINDLAAALGVDGSTITRQVALMGSDGLIERSSDPRDGRVQLISLSPNGRREMQELRRLRNARLREFTGDWSVEELETFARLLGRLTSAAVKSSR